MPYQSVSDVVRDLEANPVEKTGSLYHPIPFPEFAHLKTSSRPAGVRAKWRLIREAAEAALPGGLRGARVLDVGANAGFYTFSFAQLGASVTAYEPHVRYGAIGEFLARKKQVDVRWVRAPFDLAAAKREKADVALMLSCFQWMTDGDRNLEEGRQILRELSKNVGILIFELGLNSGKSAITTKRLNHVAALRDMLLGATTYNFVEPIGSTRIWLGHRRHVFACSHARLPVRRSPLHLVDEIRI